MLNYFKNVEDSLSIWITLVIFVLNLCIILQCYLMNETYLLVAIIATSLSIISSIFVATHYIVKKIKEDTAFKVHIEEVEKHNDACFMTISDRLDKIENQLQEQGRNVAKIEGILQSSTTKKK